MRVRDNSTTPGPEATGKPRRPTRAECFEEFYRIAGPALYAIDAAEAEITDASMASGSHRPTGRTRGNSAARG
jgi:hypothetical protein